MFGQDFLSNYLGDFGDDYILIGGNACVLNFEKIKVPFRATVDLDLVLIVDRENSKFYSHLCDYLIEYGYTGGLYRCKNKGSCSYRFELKGEQKVERPKVIELFSRKPDYFDEELSEKLHITPIFTEDGISNMSAMLLDDEIYYFVVENQIKIDNISTVTLPCIFGLKSIAWHNNVELFKGSKVKEGDVYKHPADMIRIASVITGEEYLYPEGIFNSIQHSKEMFEEGDVLNNIPDVSENVGDVIEFINEFVRLKP
ncbi:hypothetical protein [Citrobacter portucalensis]|uniref:hypothetical protein n=1 Tax=Citrobacter portucalensis TaxID=1639133 RepID=UPI0012997E5A|nr:hypothetical protein [Citrobacter portucalensis]MRF57622.1 hypothetical protein [Citrobacter portucalensis]